MTDKNRSRDAYHYFSTIQTRWMDNDVYGHVNNVTYYSYFDTVANNYLIEKGGLDIQNSDAIAYVVASNCEYKAPVTHPCTVNAGFRVNKLGSKSVRYGIAIFVGDNQKAAAHGTFTHVFVDRESGKSVAIPEQIRTALEETVFEADKT